MKLNFYLGLGLIVSVIFAILNTIFIEPTNQVLADQLYSVVGLVMFALGIWGGIRLRQS